MCQSTPPAELELPVAREAPSLAREFLRGSPCAEHHSAVDCDEASLQVRVRDGSPDLPAPRDAAHGDENGRGLALVAEMSADWGVDTEQDGKHVWFVIN